MSNTVSEVGGSVNPRLLARVLEAAETCFDRHGVHGTTMEHVAQEAGLSRGLIYKYLGNRDGVVLAVLERRARIFNSRARAFLDTRTSFQEALLEGILLAVRSAHRDPHFGVLVDAVALDKERQIPGASGLARQLADELWRPVIQRARDAGELAAGVDVDDLLDWITYLELTLLAGREAAGTAESDQARHLRTLFIPAVVNGTIPVTTTKETA